MNTTPTGTRNPAASGGTTSAGWPVPAALAALSAIPLTAGVPRLVQLAGGPAVVPADDRFTGFPVALVVDIVGAAVYALVGALQFVPRFRRRHPTWHRRAGRLLVVTGLMVAGSAVWLTLFYPARPGTGDLLYIFRLLFATAMAACLVLGFTAIRRRHITAHRAWMIRAYAIGLGAGTQVFTEGFGGALIGTGVVVVDLAKTAGWVLNLAVAEWVIGRHGRCGKHNRQRPASRPAHQPSGATP